MISSSFRMAIVLGLGAAALPMAHAQVFTVGEKTATDDIKTDFKPTRVELPAGRMSERGRRELVREFDAEQGFAHRTLPLGTTILLNANGTMKPSGDAYRALVYKKGQSAGIGDRVIVTALAIKPDRILVDLNGGPYAPNRIMRHVQISVGGATTAAPDLMGHATGCRVELLFEGGVPEISGPEMKALLSPIVDFGVKTGDLAYAETLPPAIKGAIDLHEVLVGMNHRMVLAAMGEPESKVRESNETDGTYEEWIFGHQPQTVQFVRFVGDRVSQVKVAAMGQPIVVRTENEMGNYQIEPKTHTVIIADGPAPSQQKEHGDVTPPTLKLPDEAKTPAESETGTTERRVQYPVPKKDPGSTSGSEASPAASSGPATGVPAPPLGNAPSPPPGVIPDASTSTGIPIPKGITPPPQ
jgi:hypothetical protein